VGVEHPNLNFGSCPDTHDTHSGCPTGPHQIILLDARTTCPYSLHETGTFRVYMRPLDCKYTIRTHNVQYARIKTIVTVWQLTSHQFSNNSHLGIQFCRLTRQSIITQISRTVTVLCSIFSMAFSACRLLEYATNVALYFFRNSTHRYIDVIRVGFSIQSLIK